MYTSIVCVALAGSADVSAALPKAPAWQTDYSAAQKIGAEEKKPLVVVIGRGPDDVAAVSRDGKLDPSVVEALQAHYVCVYIDATSERGQKLADAFEMKSGLVISDRSGEKQAFRHEGTLTNGDLGRVLNRFADPDRVVERTETQQRTEVRYYPGDASPGVPAFAPSYLQMGGFSQMGGCRT